MRMCRNPHVLQLCASFVVDTDLWIITPLMDKGSPHFLPFVAWFTQIYAPFVRLKLLCAADTEAPSHYFRERRLAGKELHLVPPAVCGDWNFHPAIVNIRRISLQPSCNSLY